MDSSDARNKSQPHTTNDTSNGATNFLVYSFQMIHVTMRDFENTKNNKKKKIQKKKY